MLNQLSTVFLILKYLLKEMMKELDINTMIDLMHHLMLRILIQQFEVELKQKLAIK